MAHKTLHRKQNMEKHQSRSMPKPEVHVQCQNRKCTFNAKNRKLTYNDINMIVKFVQLLLYLRTKLKKTQKPFKTYLIIYNINLRTKDKRYLQILDMKVITINTLLKQLNKLPSLHFILFLSLYLYLYRYVVVSNSGLISNGRESTVDLLTVCESRFEALNIS